MLLFHGCCCSVLLPATLALSHSDPITQPRDDHTPSVNIRTDMLSDSDDERLCDGLAYVMSSRPRVSSLPHPPPKRHCPADRSTRDLALHSVPAPASVPSPLSAGLGMNEAELRTCQGLRCDRPHHAPCAVVSGASVPALCMRCA